MGSGRLALPLAARGVEVHGIDASEAMLDRLRTKPGGEAIRLTTGDMADLEIVGPPAFSVVFAAFNTLFNLTTARRSSAAWSASRGCSPPTALFVVEAFVPADDDEGGRLVGEAAPHLGRRGRALGEPPRWPQQTITGQHIHVTEQGIRLRPWHLRYARPAELDAMADAAGLALAWRHADWDGDALRPRLQRPRVRLPPR